MTAHDTPDPPHRIVWAGGRRAQRRLAELVQTHPQDAQALGEAWLLDHRVQPDGHGGPLVAARGSAVAGTLWALSAQAWHDAAGLALGAPPQSHPRPAMGVADALGHVHEPTVLWVGEDAEPLPPSALDVGPRTLFVYGTLRQGECRAEALGDPDPQPIVAACVPGRLWHTLDDYPVWTPLAAAEAGAPGAPQVRGELVTWAAPPPWERLDAVEEFHGFGSEASLFVRTLVRATDDAGRAHLAWAYLAGPAVQRDRPIPSGDWCRREPAP